MFPRPPSIGLPRIWLMRMPSCVIEKIAPFSRNVNARFLALRTSPMTSDDASRILNLSRTAVSTFASAVRARRRGAATPPLSSNGAQEDVVQLVDRHRLHGKIG